MPRPNGEYKTQYPRTCERCGKDFVAWNKRGRFCSPKCYRSAATSRRYHRKRADNLCPHCLKNSSTETHVLCDSCRSKAHIRTTSRTAAQRERISEWKKDWVEGKPGYYAAVGYKSRDKLRRQVFDHYGNRCACCGLDDWRFLTIDHIDGKGNQHRRETFNGRLVAGSDFYRWLRKNSYPEGFQLLCYNCNCAQSRFNGICPHKLNKIDPEIVGLDSVD